MSVIASVTGSIRCSMLSLSRIRYSRPRRSRSAVTAVGPVMDTMQAALPEQPPLDQPMNRMVSSLGAADKATDVP